MASDALIHILHTERYVVDVDSRKNRIYMRVLEEGQEFHEPSRFLEEFHEVKHHLSNGFTMLMELCPKEARPQRDTPLIRDVMDVLFTSLIRDAMDLLFEGGVRKIANVCPDISIQQEFSHWEQEPISQGVQHRGFMSREAAEAWLDAHEGASGE